MGDFLKMMDFLEELYKTLSVSLSKIESDYKEFRKIPVDKEERGIKLHIVKEELGQILVDLSLFFHLYAEVYDKIQANKMAAPNRTIIENMNDIEKRLQNRYYSYKSLKETVTIFSRMLFDVEKF